MSETTDQVQIRPLHQAEKDSEELRKDLEEKLKNFSKIELKNYNKDKEAYKQAIEDALKSLQDYLAKTSDLLKRINDLKKEDEDSSLKEKDFKKSQTNEAKKIKELQSKIEKTTKKLNQDLDKQKKADEKEDAKKAKLEDKNKKNDTKKSDNSNLREIITEIIKIDKENKQGDNTEETGEVENNEDDEEQDKSKETEKPKVALTLKEMMAQAKKAKEAREKDEKSQGHDTQDESEEDDDKEFDDEYESEKEEKESKETKEKIGQNLLNIFKNQNKKEEPAKSDEEKTRKPSTSNINKESEPIKEQQSEKKEKTTNEPDGEQNEEDKEEEDEGDEESEEGEEIEQKIEKPKLEESKPEVEYEIGAKFIVINDYDAEEEDDLDVKKGEIVEFEDLSEYLDYIKVKNSEGDSGYVLLSHLRSLAKEHQQEDENLEPVKTEDRDVEEERAGKKTKKSKKKDLINSNALIINEAVPSTFSDSTLGKLSKNPAHSYEAILKPQMSQSHLNFNNFYWDSKDNKIRNRITSIIKSIKLHKCVNIPVPNKTDLEVLTRTVRICLFDGVSVLANIYTIRAHVVSKDERTWHFEDQYNDVISLVDFSEFFLLTNTIPEKPKLGLLFELSIYAKKPNTEEETELCCGWAHLPFMDSENNFQLVNKSYDLVLNGGSVYDKNMPLDPNVPRNTGPINDIITKLFKESKIKFTVKDPTSQDSDILNVLPSPLICSSLTSTFIKYYYEELAANFLVPLNDLGSFDVSTEPIHSEFLKTFPRALENPDILNAVRIVFNYQKVNLKRDEKNDQLRLRKLFLKIYSELCYPLLFNYTLPPLVLHKQEFMESRQITIDLLAKKSRKESSIEYLFDDNYKFEPFYTEELRFEIVA